jgi:hypothetical protein
VPHVNRQAVLFVQAGSTRANAPQTSAQYGIYALKNEVSQEYPSIGSIKPIHIDPSRI